MNLLLCVLEGAAMSPQQLLVFIYSCVFSKLGVVAKGFMASSSFRASDFMATVCGGEVAFGEMTGFILTG